MDSAFGQYLHTNYAPTETEIHSIRDDLVPHLVELARLEALICDLTAQRDQIKAYVDSHKALLSPARRIPRDLIQEIFLACLPTHRNAVMSNTEAPLLLCRICSAWRAIAISTPQLWASLHIHLEHIVTAGLVEQRVSAVAEWLGRSAQCPISLSIAARNVTRVDGGEFQAGYNLLMDILAPSSTRWEDITLIHLPGDAAARLENFDIPKLKAIKVQGNAFSPNSPLLHKNTIRRLSLLHTKPESFIKDMQVDWDRLTHLSLIAAENCTLDAVEILSILRMCPRLVSARFDLDRSRNAEPINITGGPVLLPTLETLAVDFKRSFQLMEYLIMPELCHLRLSGGRFSPVFTNSAFFAPLQVGSPKLETLELNPLLFTPETLTDTLLLFPCITSLRLTTTSDSHLFPFHQGATVATVLTALSPGVCPMLRDIDITGAINDEKVVVFAEQRLRTGAEMHSVQNGNYPLRRLHVQSSHPPPRRNRIPDFQALRSRGLDISVEYDPNPTNRLISTPWSGLEPGALINTGGARGCSIFLDEEWEAGVVCAETYWSRPETQPLRMSQQ